MIVMTRFRSPLDGNKSPDVQQVHPAHRPSCRSQRNGATTRGLALISPCITVPSTAEDRFILQWHRRASTLLLVFEILCSCKPVASHSLMCARCTLRDIIFVLLSLFVQPVDQGKGRQIILATSDRSTAVVPQARWISFFRFLGFILFVFCNVAQCKLLPVPHTFLCVFISPLVVSFREFVIKPQDSKPFNEIITPHPAHTPKNNPGGIPTSTLRAGPSQSDLSSSADDHRRWRGPHRQERSIRWRTPYLPCHDDSDCPRSSQQQPWRRCPGCTLQRSGGASWYPVPGMRMR